MLRRRTEYPEEFRRQVVELHRAGRSARALAKEFEPSEQTIPNWIKQAQLDAGERKDGLTSTENDELRRLRRENRQLKINETSCQKPQPGSQGRPAHSRTDLRVRGGSPGPVPGRGFVPRASSLPEWILRLG